MKNLKHNNNDFKQIFFVMRNSILLVFLCVATAFAHDAKSQVKKMSLRANDMPLSSVIAEIERQTDYLFVYDKSEIDVKQKVSIDARNRTVAEVLQATFANSDVVYAMEGNNIMLMKSTMKTTDSQQQQQGRRVSGVIRDAEGEPVAGATVVQKGTSNGTATDNDGRFTLTVPDNAVLVINFLGFKQQEVSATAIDGKSISLVEDTQALDEVVVVGYGVQKKVNLSGAVQAVSSKDIANRPVTNANLALQGLAANVNIQQLSGRASTVADVNVRGYTSINGGSALILIDNVPVTAEELSRINPEDIESMSVLKDAASSAIYGGRAAFGVILITTKTARKEKLEISADVNYGVRSLAYVPELMTDVYEQITYMNAASTRNPMFTADDFELAKNHVENPELYPGTVVNVKAGRYSVGQWAYFNSFDWIGAFLRDYSPTLTGNVRVANKTERMSYAVSGGYYRQDGMMVYGNDRFNRFNLRGNGTYKLTDWWQVGSNMSFNYSNYDMAEVGDDWYFWQVSRNPIRAIYTPDGNYTIASAIILGLAKEGGRVVTRTNETQLSFNTTIDLIKDVWTVKADANFRFTNSNTRKGHYPVYYSTGPDQPLAAIWAGIDVQYERFTYAQTTNALNSYNVYNAYTDFHKTFANKHFVQALLGFNQEELIYTYSYIRKTDLVSNALPTVNLANGTATVSESIKELALRGAFGRLNYIFDNRYILELNGRYDGTSRFPTDSRFGFFPSASLAWVLSREKFLENLAQQWHVDQFKLRGSYGVLGNQVLSDYYPYLAIMSTTPQTTVPINGARPMKITQPGVVAGDLTWERVRTVNYAFDLSLFDSRITLSADKYTRYTEGMLVQGKQLPTEFGATPPKENAGDLKTQGWEVVVGLNNTFQVKGHPLHVGLDFMIADSRSYITKFDNETHTLGRNGTPAYYEGMEIGEIWGFENASTFLTKDDLILNDDGTPSGKTKIDQYQVGSSDNKYLFYEGDVKFVDLDGDNAITWGKETIDDPGDRKIIGNTSMRYPYSFNLRADYRGFDVRAFFQGVGKRNWYPMYNFHDFWGVYTDFYSAPIVANRDHWTEENPNAFFPRLKPSVASSTAELGTPQTRYLQDVSYLRFKNLTIGYSLPAQLMKNWFISNARVYASAENIFTFNHLDVGGIDPETVNLSDQSNLYNKGIYPMQKVYTIGLSVNF